MPSAGLIRFAMLLLLFATNCAATETLCSATRPSGPATSNSASQQAKECEVPSILDCSGGTSASSASSASTASYVSSASESTDSASYASAAESSSTVASAEPSSSAAASSSSEPCPCVLIQELVNLRNAYLDSAQQTIFDECLDDIRVVLVNAINITVKQQVSEIALLLRKCFAANADIEALLKFQTISSWGRIFEFMAAGISFCSENVDSVIAVDASGSCTLTEAIVNATAGDLCGSGSSAQIQSICDDANYVLRKQISGYDKGRKLGWIGKVFEKNLFVLYPQIESCVRNVTIPGFGSVDQFLSVCDQYETSSSLGSGVLNGTGSDCALVKSLNESLHSNATVNSTDSATLQEALNYVSNCSAYFAQTSDVAARLKFVSAQCSQLSSACRLLLYPIQISGTYQSIDFSDVVVTSHFCDNDGCGNITYGSASLTWPETCMIDSAQNISDIEYAVNIFYANLTVVQKTSFNSYKNSITNCIRSSSYGTNYTARIECVQTYVQNYASNNSAMRAVFLAVECVTVLVETVTSVVFGTFGNLCGCSS